MRRGMWAALAILVVVVGGFWAAQHPWGTPQVRIRAAVESAGQLENGDEVIYRGVPVGKVSDISLSPANDGVYVSMMVRQGLRFPPDAAIVIEPEAVLGGWQVEVVSKSWHPEIRFAQPRSALVMPGGTMTDLTQLTSAASQIEAAIDTVATSFTPVKAREVVRVVDHAKVVSDEMRLAMDRQAHSFSATGGHVLATSAHARGLTDTVRLNALAMHDSLTRGSIHAMLANAREASAGLNALSARFAAEAANAPGMVARAGATLATVQHGAESLNRMVGARGPQAARLSVTLQQAQDAMRTLERAVDAMQQDSSALGRMVRDPAQYEQTLRAMVTLREMLDDLQENPGKYISLRPRR
jgi:ABC-type transporter Mla subunit MlaD